MQSRMPILREEPNLFPDNLLDGGTDQSTDRQWWVLYTKARQEKAVSRHLLRHGTAFYLPLLKKKTMVRARKVHSFVPLFPGYVFMCGSEEERTNSLIGNRVSRVLRVDDPQRRVFDLGQFRRLLASDAPITVEPQLPPGQRVRLVSGALAGLEGTVLTQRGMRRLLVCVDFLQQGASVEIEDGSVEPID